MADEAKQSKKWWLDVVRARFHERGKQLSTRPPVGEMCYYGNPLGALALDWRVKETSPPWQSHGDMCRDWDFTCVGSTHFWKSLQCLPASESVLFTNLQKSLNRLWQCRNDGKSQAVSFMGLYEWMAAFERMCECLLKGSLELNRGEVSACMWHLVSDTSRFGQLHATGWARRILCAGYIAAMERAEIALNLSAADWGGYIVEPKVKSSGNNMAYQWVDAPPYAALVLLEWIRGDRGVIQKNGTVIYREATPRGADDLPAILCSWIEYDELIRKISPNAQVSRSIEEMIDGRYLPGYVRSIKKLVPDLNKAMAVDRFLYENPVCVDRLIQLMNEDQCLDGNRIVKSNHSMVDPLRQLIDTMALHWHGGFHPIGQFFQAKKRFADPAIATSDHALVSVSDIQVVMLGVEPRIFLDLPWTTDELPLPDDFSAVVYCEAWEGDVAQTEDMFVDVSDVVWADRPGYISVELEITEWNCLLFKWPRRGKHPFLSGALWSKDSVNRDRPVIGVRIFMGRLMPES